MTGRGQARKALLLAAARTVFERRGFLGTRVADIVAEANVAQGTFYTYFDSKEAGQQLDKDVLLATLTTVWARDRRRRVGAAGPTCPVLTGEAPVTGEPIRCRA